MKNSELIKELQALDPDLEVKVTLYHPEDDDSYGIINYVKVNKYTGDITLHGEHYWDY